MAAICVLGTETAWVLASGVPSTIEWQEVLGDSPRELDEFGVGVGQIAEVRIHIPDRTQSRREASPLPMRSAQASTSPSSRHCDTWSMVLSEDGPVANRNLASRAPV